MKYFRYFNKSEYLINGKKYNIADITQSSVIDNLIKDDITYYNYYNIIDGERPEHVSMRLYDTPDYYFTFFLMNPNINNYYTDWYRSTQTQLQFLKKKYNKFVIEFDDNIANKFNIGETVVSSTNVNVIAEVVDIDTELRRLIVKNPKNGNDDITFDSNINNFFKSGSGVRGVGSNGFGVSTGFYRQYQSTHSWLDDDGNVTYIAAGTERRTIQEYENDINDEKGRIIVIKPEYIENIISDFINKMGE